MNDEGGKNATDADVEYQNDSDVENSKDDDDDEEQDQEHGQTSDESDEKESDGKQGHEVGDQKRPTAVAKRHVGKPPDVSQADC